MRLLSLTLYLMLAGCSLFGQRLDSAQLDLGRLRVHVSPDGSWGSDQQAFLEYRKEDGSYVSLLQKGGLQYGGVQPGGDLTVANFDGTSNAAGRTDTAAALTGVWKVTQADILAHLDDFEDNGVIDNPLPSIYSWPAFNNPHFIEYTGQPLPKLFTAGLADFWDHNSDGVYDPDAGDTPYLSARNGVQQCGPREVPTEMYWLTFHQVPSDLSPGVFDGQFMMTFASYACTESNEQAFENRTFILYVKTVNYGFVDHHDAVFGYNLLSAIGDPGNDAIGSDSSRALNYFYTDALQDDQFGTETIPAVGVLSLRGPFDEVGQERPLANTVPIYNYQNGPPVFEPAQTRTELYNLLQGHWKDGSPLTFGGNGYETGDPTPFAFSGNPGEANDWTYADLMNTPESVGVSSSFAGIQHIVGSVNELIYLFSVTTQGTDAFERVDSLQADNTGLQSVLLDAGICGIYDQCDPLSSVAPYAGAISDNLKVYPNPVGNNEGLKLVFGNNQQPTIASVTVMDALGRKVTVGWSPAVKTLDVSALPAGQYFLLVGTDQGDWYRTTFVK